MPAHDESCLLRIRFQHGAFPHFPAFLKNFSALFFASEKQAANYTVRLYPVS
jgi:hypothetical protein